MPILGEGLVGAERPQLPDRIHILAEHLRAALAVHEERLSGRPFDTETLAEVIAVALVAYEDAEGSRGALKDKLKPAPRQAGGFKALWSKQTCELVMDRGVQGIKCLRCGRTSYHPEDVRHRFCGQCDEFHDGE